MQPQRSSNAEVVGVEKAIVYFDLLALNADVRNPMLAATVRASGDMQFHVLIESRQTLFEFFHQPAREAFGLGDREFAEFRTAARDRSARERRTLNRKTNGT